MKDVLLEALSPADIGDDTYNVGRYQNPDGRLHLIFTTEAQKREIDTRKFSFTRLTYRQFVSSSFGTCFKARSKLSTTGNSSLITDAL